MYKRDFIALEFFEFESSEHSNYSKVLKIIFKSKNKTKVMLNRKRLVNLFIHTYIHAQRASLVASGERLPVSPSPSVPHCPPPEIHNQQEYTEVISTAR